MTFDGSVYVITCALVLVALTYRKRIPANVPAISSCHRGPRGARQAPCLDAAPPTFFNRGSSRAGAGTPSDLSSSNELRVSKPGSLSGLPPPGAPAVSLYWWRSPARAKQMMLNDPRWTLEFIDARYGQWLIRKEESW